MTDANILTVRSVAELVEQLAKMPLKNGHMRFFRGHADFKQYKIRPSIYRNRSLISNESSLIQEAIVRCPADFPDSCTFFEKLVRLQLVFP